MRSITILIIALSISPVYAGIYKCESGGEISYQNKPCSNGKLSVMKEKAPSNTIEVLPTKTTEVLIERDYTLCETLSKLAVSVEKYRETGMPMSDARRIIEQEGTDTYDIFHSIMRAVYAREFGTGKPTIRNNVETMCLKSRKKGNIPFYN